MEHGMNKYKLSLITSTLLLTQALPAYATDVNADSLIGKFYGGIHAAYLNADNDRIDDEENDFNKGTGLGLEGGYRFSAPLELRLSYSHFKSEDSDPDSVNKASFDTLYFPTEKNVYLLGGLSSLDLDSSWDASVNAGVGYRHYFSHDLAVYAEGKVNYQFEDTEADTIAQIGFTYFFGANQKTSPIEPIIAPVKAASFKQAVVEKPVKAIEAIAEAPAKIVESAFIDNDSDGVEDRADQCLTTPKSDKVDEVGCTVFAEESLSFRLSVQFDSSKSVVKKEYYAEIAQMAAFFKQYPHIKATVDGYSSVDGNDAYNKKLSQQRADAIVNMLVTDYGIDASRLTAIGHGETNLIDTALTAAAHKKNRRIEVNVLDTHKKAVIRK